MSEVKKAGVFYSDGSGLAARLQELRRRHPEAHVTVITPQHHSLNELEASLADAVLEQPHAHYPIREPGRLRDLVRQIRAERFDVFVTMYPSPRLRLIASMSGARRPQCWTYESRIIPLARTLPGAVLAIAGRALKGRLSYLYWWCRVRFHRVPMPGEVDKLDRTGPRLPRR